MPFSRRCRPRSKRASSRSKASNVSLAVSRGHTDREEGVGVRVGAGAELRLVPLAQLRAGGVVTRPLSRTVGDVTEDVFVDEGGEVELSRDLASGYAPARRAGDPRRDETAAGQLVITARARPKDLPRAYLACPSTQRAIVITLVGKFGGHESPCHG
jgi:hypothetical protein